MAKEETLPQPVSTMTAAQLARRRRLTDAVIEMIDQMPPDQLQMRDVAERSGVALGTAYRYFSSKDHLLAAAWADWQRRLKENGVWVSEPVPMFPFPGSPQYVETFGAQPDEDAWERAHSFYLDIFAGKGYSDIQEQNPQSLRELECVS